jgi:hypothetical protein
MSQTEWENLASLLSLVTAAFAAILLIAGLVPRAVLDAIEKRTNAVARQRILCFILLPALSLGTNLLIARHNGIPIPAVHDEFSYLLAADTFSHGRLTNPTPAFWEHFETPQQLVRPTYMSKYPPGQGIALAVGQVLCNLPIAGVWISTALAVLAIYWMMLAFLPRNWALLGGIVAALHPQLLDWSQNYWGGSVAVLGAALVLGAWGRLMISHDALSGVWLAVGLIILANSRPFEGLVLSVPLMLGLGFSRGKNCFSLLIPAGVPLLIGALLMGYYNFRVTGNPWRSAYLEYISQYEIYPKLWIMSPRPAPVYRNVAMQFAHQDFDGQAYLAMHTLSGVLFNTPTRLRALFDTNLNLMVLLVPFALGIFTRWRAGLVWVILAVALVGIAGWAELFLYRHYIAPMLPGVLLLTMVGWRKLARWTWQDRPIGRALAIATVAGFLAGAGMVTAQPLDRTTILVAYQELQQLLPRLQKGRHLIFVTYAPMHSLHVDFVHNRSDPDQSQIIWVRSFGPKADLPVARHYTGRQVWLLHVGGKLDLEPYLREQSPR